MLSRDERESQEAFAADVLWLFNERRNDVKSIRATIGPILERMASGESMQIPASLSQIPLTAQQQWCAAVWLVLKLYIPAEAIFVMQARLLRRKKSSEASWSRIAGELDTTEAHARRVFRDAVPAFVALLEAAEITERCDSVAA